MREDVSHANFYPPVMIKHAAVPVRSKVSMGTYAVHARTQVLHCEPSMRDQVHFMLQERSEDSFKSMSKSKFKKGSTQKLENLLHL